MRDKDLLNAVKQFLIDAEEELSAEEYNSVILELGAAVEKRSQQLKDLHELNEHGLLVYRHKTDKNHFIERTYRWKDSCILLYEIGDQRKILDSMIFSTFDTGAWELITKEEYKLVIHGYKDIYK